MGYRICYNSVHRKQHGLSLRFRLPVLTVLCFFLFVCLVNGNWPEGWCFLSSSIQMIRKHTEEAMTVLTDELLEGTPLTTVFSEFLQLFQI